MTRLLLIISFVFFTDLSLAQISFSKQVQLPTNGGGFYMPEKLYKIKVCADGGFAIAGHMDYFNGSYWNIGTICKFDSAGTHLWTKQIAPSFNVYDYTQLIATIDSGYYILFQRWDSMEIDVGGSFYKVNKNGDTLHCARFGFSPGGRGMCKEKYSDNLNIYTPDGLIKIDSSFSIISNDQKSINFLFAYDSLGAPWQFKMDSVYASKEKFDINLFDTLGIAINHMEYRHDSTDFQYFRIASIDQDLNQNYYLTGWVQIGSMFKLAIMKLDHNWNTVFFKAFELPSGLKMNPQLNSIGSVSPNGNIFFSAFYSTDNTYGYFGRHNIPLLLETDSMGNVINSALGTDTTYSDSDIDPKTGYFYLVSLDSLNNLMEPVIEKEHFPNLTCNYYPCSLTTSSYSIVDSLIPASNLTSLIHYIAMYNGGYTPLNNYLPLVIDKCSSLLINENAEQCEDLSFNNPANDFLNLKLCDKSKIDHILISDMNGRRIYYKSNQFNSDTELLDISNFPPGIYAIQCTFKNGNSNSRKLVVSH